VIYQFTAGVWQDRGGFVTQLRVTQWLTWQVRRSRLRFLILASVPVGEGDGTKVRFQHLVPEPDLPFLPIPFPLS
jgi:hypothetical protein